MDKTIYCSECVKDGKTPKKLGTVKDADGAHADLLLWCKQCRKRILVSIRDGKIATRAEDATA